MVCSLFYITLTTTDIVLAGQSRPQVGQNGFQPTEVQRNGFLRALRQLLQPHAVHRFLLVRHLRLANWNVQAAYDTLVAERNTRLGLPVPAPSAVAQPAVQTQAQGPGPATAAVPNAGGAGNAAATQDAADAHRIIDFMPYSPSNFEQERRWAAVVFRDQIQGLPNNSATLSVSQSVLLLQLADWDVGQALDDWAGLDDALDRLHVAFDRMRSPEGDKVAQYKKDRARSERQDERLAILINLTGRPDWRSLQLFLMQQCQWDLVKAVTIWFRSGIPVAKKAKDKAMTRKDSRQNKIPAPSDKDILADPADKKWASEPAFYRRVSDFSREDLVPIPPLHEDDRETRPYGHLINPQRGTIQAGHYFVEDHFVVEYISKGKYWYNRFQKRSVGKGGKPFKWPKFGRGYGVVASSDSDSDPNAEDKILFDFSDATHVSKLNAWRRQQFARATGVMRRKGSQRWEPMENALLHSLIKGYYDKRASGETGPVKMSLGRLNDITKFLNEAFVGTRPGAATAIRGERTPTSVGTQMRRFFPIIRDFGVKADDAWFSKNRKISKDEYKARQAQDLIDGTAQYKDWDPTEQRPPVAGGDGDSGSESDAAEYDDKIVDGDDEATKERKRHESRSEKKPIKAARKSAAAARAAEAERKAAGTDDEETGVDVLGNLPTEGGSEDGDSDVEDEAGEAKAGKKRKRGGDDDDDDDGAGAGEGSTAA